MPNIRLNKQFVNVTNLTKIDEAGDENNDDDSKRVKELRDNNSFCEDDNFDDVSVGEMVIDNLDDFFKKINCKIIKADDTTMLLSMVNEFSTFKVMKSIFNDSNDHSNATKTPDYSIRINEDSDNFASQSMIAIKKQNTLKSQSKIWNYWFVN